MVILFITLIVADACPTMLLTADTLYGSSYGGCPMDNLLDSCDGISNPTSSWVRMAEFSPRGTVIHACGAPRAAPTPLLRALDVSPGACRPGNIISARIRGIILSFYFVFVLSSAYRTTRRLLRSTSSARYTLRSLRLCSLRLD